MVEARRPHAERDDAGPAVAIPRSSSGSCCKTGANGEIVRLERRRARRARRARLLVRHSRARAARPSARRLQLAPRANALQVAAAVDANDGGAGREIPGRARRGRSRTTRASTCAVSMHEVAIHLLRGDGARVPRRLAVPLQLARDADSDAWRCPCRSSARSRACTCSGSRSTR